MKHALTAMLLLLMATSVAASAQIRRDPLNDKEADQLRETAQEPIKRMNLLISFARARMTAIEQIRANPKLTGEDGPEQVRKLLEDLAGLVDETDENLASYQGKDADLRKPLRLVIETDSDFQLKLRTLHETASPDDLKRFGFALETASDSVNSSADSARAMLDEQNATRGKEKPLTAKEEEKQRKEDEKMQKEQERDNKRIDKRQQQCPVSPC